MVDVSGTKALIRADARVRFDAALDIFKAATEEVTPVASGALARAYEVSGTEDSGSGFTATISNPMEYAAAQDTGSRPHIIRPRNKLVLRFEVAGETVFAKEVHHPGTRALGFFTAAAPDRWHQACEQAFA